MNVFRRWLRRCARRCGYDVTSYTILRSHDLRRAKLLNDHAITLVIDGGANRGQFASKLRDLGYSGRILSIEPDPTTFATLSANCSTDKNWQAINSALAERVGEGALHVSSISEVSSLLPATGALGTVGWREDLTKCVRLTTVDSLLADVQLPGDVTYLKLDLQGYEERALAGATQALQTVAAVELELSTVELYEGGGNMVRILALLEASGFVLCSIEPTLVDYDTGHVMQLDSLFLRSALLPAGPSASPLSRPAPPIPPRANPDTR